MLASLPAPVLDHKVKTRVTFGWEPVSRILQEPNIKDLILEHWRELAVHKDEMPLDPDYGRMLAADDAGLFKVWAARDGKTLVGYVAFWIQPHAHYKSTLTAVEDLYMLTASHRKGLTGYRMFTSAIAALKHRGVKRCYMHSKVHWNKERGGMAVLFERLGFVNTDMLWSKIL